MPAEWIRFIATTVSVKEMCRLWVLVLSTLELSFGFSVFFSPYFHSLFLCDVLIFYSFYNSSCLEISKSSY